MSDIKNYLFTPLRMGSLEVKNRLIRSATNERMADAEGRATEELVSLYRKLVIGGVGLIITGHAYVSKRGKAGPNQIGIYSDELISDLKKAVEEVHRIGGKIVMQISHAGRQTKEEIIGDLPLAPSPIPLNPWDTLPQEMTEEEIEEVIAAFAKAAERVKRAGFDGVQIHGAHGYLVGQFLSPSSNQRKGAWGGSIENRSRFLLEVYRRMRKMVGGEYPILIKLGAVDFVKNGLTIEESVQVAKWLEEEGINGIEVSGNVTTNYKDNIRPKVVPGINEAYNLPSAERIKREVKVPVILVGGMRSPEIMGKLILQGKVDTVSLSRPLIREPGFSVRVEEGNREPSPCVSCNLCLIRREGGIRCHQVSF